MGGFCTHCGGKLEFLDDISCNSGASWFGCSACNTVWQHNYCSLSGRSRGYEKFWMSYTDYKATLEKRNG